MQKASNNKFIYKKDTTDWEIIFVVLMTIALFAFIFYGNQYFEGRDEVRSPDDHKEINKMVNERSNLEDELNRYRDNQDFNVNVDR